MAPPKGHKFSVGNSGGGRSPEFDWEKEYRAGPLRLAWENYDQLGWYVYE